MTITRRIAAAVLALAAAGALAGCLPNSGTVTTKRSSYSPASKQWSYFVSVDGDEYSVSGGDYLTCDIGDKVVDGECK